MACAALTLASCEDLIDPEEDPIENTEDDPSTPDEPGTDDPTPVTPEIVVADVLFSVDNGEYCFYASEADDTKTATLKVIRSNSEIADSYAIKVNDASEGLEIPETVEFEAGQTEATITIVGPATGKALDKYDFDLSLTGDNVNTSVSSTAGTLRCEGTIYVYEEVTAVGFFGGSAYYYLGDFPQTVWRMADNKMILKNFLGSENDLAFTYAKEHEYGEDGTDYGQSIDALEYSAENYVYITDSDYDKGSTCFYFYDYDANKYEWFYPKGEQRYLYGLGLYLGNNYSAYVKTDDYDYLYFYAFEADFYGESEGIQKEMEWQSLYFNFVDPSNYDFESFPVFPDYPESGDVTPEAGSVPLYCYLIDGSGEYIYFDDQVGTVSTDSDGNKVLTISNFLNSTETVTITQTSAEDEEIEFEFEGGVVNGDWLYVSKWYYPWSKDNDWSVGYFSFHSGYCSGSISEEYIYVSLGAYSYLYHGEKPVVNNVWSSLNFYYSVSE